MLARKISYCVKSFLVASEGHELVYVTTLNAQNRQGKV